ncbi:DNA repair protein RecO [bacterium]|nr:DNA repair protein RecO [bacterium]
MQSQVEPGIILRVSPHKESDAVLTILGKNQGRFAAYARGVRKSSKRFSGGIDVFDSGDFELEEAFRSGGMPSLVGIRSRTNYLGLRKNYERFHIAAICLELVLVISQEGDPASTRYYEPTQACLACLDSLESRNELFLAGSLFIYRILQTTGVDPLLNAAGVGPETRKRWEAVIKQEGNLTLVASDYEQAFLELVNHAQNFIGKNLKSTRGLLQSQSE